MSEKTEVEYTYYNVNLGDNAFDVSFKMELTDEQEAYWTELLYGVSELDDDIENCISWQEKYEEILNEGSEVLLELYHHKGVSWYDAIPDRERWGQKNVIEKTDNIIDLAIAFGYDTPGQFLDAVLEIVADD